ncbi:MAG: metallophosphoesterase [Planctomycetota bacterium]|nr:metallophosphoesterase [Planctomycetota bacterium]
MTTTTGSNNVHAAGAARANNAVASATPGASSSRGLSDRRAMLDRRGMLGVLGGSAAVAAMGSSAVAAAAHPERKRSLRIAHMTDTHVQPEHSADQGVAACLNHASDLKDKPSLIITGGDTIMDSFEADEARTKLQWEIWTKLVKNEASVPVKSCVGNHDIWGWNKSKSKTTGKEAAWGKKWVCDVFGVDKPYHSFAQSGWHFIILDSTQPDGDGYLAYLDEPQFDWLAGELGRIDRKTNVLVVSHIPIFSVTPFAEFDKAEKDRAWNLGGSTLHTDSRKIRHLFRKHPNVRACVSGHIHLVDACEYEGVKYFCNGAVSGAWWQGAHHQCEEGYALLDLYDDGTVERQYVTYGWKARA